MSVNPCAWTSTTAIHLHSVVFRPLPQNNPMRMLYWPLRSPLSVSKRLPCKAARP